jgi:hypothetical protein
MGPQAACSTLAVQGPLSSTATERPMRHVSGNSVLMNAPAHPHW